MEFLRRAFALNKKSKAASPKARQQEEPARSSSSLASSKSKSPRKNASRKASETGSTKSTRTSSMGSAYKEEDVEANLGFSTPVGFRPEPSGNTPAEQVIYAWLMAFQHHDMAKLEELTSIKSIFVFEEIDGGLLEFQCRDILAVAGNFWEGFPDCAYGWDSIVEDDQQEEGRPTTVTLANWRWFGHHTGVPYIHEPYPPIEAEGKFILDGPLMMKFHLGKGEDGNLHITKTVAKGRNMGPHGTYEKLGGILI